MSVCNFKTTLLYVAAQVVHHLEVAGTEQTGPQRDNSTSACNPEGETGE